MAGMTVTEDRLVNVDFSNTYATGVQVRHRQGRQPPSPAVDDLFAEGANHTIGVQTAHHRRHLLPPTTSRARVWAPSSASTPAPTPCMALITGKIDCVVIDNEPAKAFVAANEGLKILDTEYAVEDYAIARGQGQRRADSPS